MPGNNLNADAADYWRAHLRSVWPSGRESDGSAMVDNGHYIEWMANLGNTALIASCDTDIYSPRLLR